MTAEIPDRFCYVYSCDLHANIQIKIGTLEGQRDRPNYASLIEDPMLRFSGICQDTCAELYVTCQLYADNRPLALPVQTSHKAFTTRWNWNEWLTLPVKYSDLPHTAYLALTVWDIYGPLKATPVGGTTIALFGKYGTFRQGMHDLKVWPGIEADGMSPTTTAGKSSGKEDEMSRLAKLSKKHRDGHMPKVDWLDRLTFREIEMINEKQKRDSNFMYLMIEFPKIHFENTDFTVVYFEKGGDDVYQMKTTAEMVSVPDPEIQLENLVESKHHKLARSLRSGPTDKDLKPNASTRDQLTTIVEYPPTKVLSSEEKDLVWKFRFYLSSQKKALTKFLKSVDWSVAQECKQALEILQHWAPMAVEDSLELLSPVFTQPILRKYAVTRLQQADDEDLLLYLLQLVQALKFEDFEEIQTAWEREEQQSAVTTPITVPQRRDTVSSLSSEDSTDTNRRTEEETVDEDVVGHLHDSEETDAILDAGGDDIAPQDTPILSSAMDLATFLIRRSCKNPVLANYFCWYLRVECDELAKDSRKHNMYVTVLKRFSLALRMGSVECLSLRSAIVGQQEVMAKLFQLIKSVARESGSRKKKIEKLHSLLVDTEALKYNFQSFEAVPLPLDPNVLITGIIPATASLFKSARMPARLTFRTMDNKEYITIFKDGDDLRQDQLVLQMITLMDKLLRRENLDLKLTPYKVLATSGKQGFVQFIESVSVAEVLSTEGSILNYFRKVAPQENASQGVAPEVMDNYVKSCAGYCILTYLLGVGDRHLDNLLLTKTGKLFHIDFGYILGIDPKPLPPPMKLSREMVEAMGGLNSEHFANFKKLCYTAFLQLRKSANLILNLFSLMVESSVPHIALEPDKTVKKVQDKFHLDLNDEEVVHYMQGVIDVSVSATMAAFMEQMHKIAQFWRK